jgi:hypothetical protein
MPRVGYKERPVLNELQTYIQYKILRQDPRFRYVIGRIPDGYIDELKLVILFDEVDHFNEKECLTLNNDSLEESMNYGDLDDHILLRISEKDWIEDKKRIINNFKMLIGEGVK